MSAIQVGNIPVAERLCNYVGGLVSIYFKGQSPPLTKISYTANPFYCSFDPPP